MSEPVKAPREWEVFYRRLEALAIDLCPGRMLVTRFESSELERPGWSNGRAGWWFKDGGFMTFANMIVENAFVEDKR